MFEIWKYLDSLLPNLIKTGKKNFYFVQQQQKWKKYDQVLCIFGAYKFEMTAWTFASNIEALKLAKFTYIFHIIHITIKAKEMRNIKTKTKNSCLWARFRSSLLRLLWTLFCSFCRSPVVHVFIMLLSFYFVFHSSLVGCVFLSNICHGLCVTANKTFCLRLSFP